MKDTNQPTPPRSEQRRRSQDKIRHPSKEELNFLERVLFRLFKGDPTFEDWRTNLPSARRVALRLHGWGLAAWHLSLTAVLITVLAIPLLSLHGSFRFAAIGCIVTGILLDGFDGVLARVGKRPAPFGLSGDVIDSLCDLLRILTLIAGVTLTGYAPMTTWTVLLAGAVISHTFACGLKNRLVMGRVFSLFSQTTVIGGSLLLIILGPEVTRPVTPFAMKIISLIAAGLALHSFILWLRVRKSPPNERAS